MSASSPHISLFSDLSSLRFDWLWVYDGHVPMTEIWSRTIPVPASVFFILKGRARLEVDGRTVDAPAGSAFLAASGARRQWFAKGTRLLSVAYKATWPDGSPLYREGLNTIVTPRKVASLMRATRKLYAATHGRKREVPYSEAIRKQPLNFAAWCAREAAFREWFSVYGRTLSSLGIEPATRQTLPDARLREMLQRLDAWPLDRPLDCAVIASSLKLGSRRMEQLLAAGLGQTPHGYLNARRLDTARQRLISGEGSLKEISFALGFRYTSHFTSWFKRHTSSTPGAYRTGSGQGAV